MGDCKNKTRKYSGKNIERKKNEKIEVIKCLCCDKFFDSFNKFHRICDSCKKSEKFESTYI